MHSERSVCFVLGSPRLPCGRQVKTALKKVAEVSEGTDECQVRLKGRECDYWIGKEIGMLGGMGFRAK